MQPCLPLQKRSIQKRRLWKLYFTLELDLFFIQPQISPFTSPNKQHRGFSVPSIPPLASLCPLSKKTNDMNSSSLRMLQPSLDRSPGAIAHCSIFRIRLWQHGGGNYYPVVVWSWRERFGSLWCALLMSPIKIKWQFLTRKSWLVFNSFTASLHKPL